MRSKNTNTAERERRMKLQQLMDARLQQFPNESFDARFAAVTASDEGQQLFAQMHIANEDAVPVQSPRHAALLDRLWPIPDAEFKRLWLAKYGPLSAGSETPGYATESETRRRTAEAAGSFQGDAKLKDKSRRGFLDEVARLMATGHDYSQAWSIATSTSPGKEFYMQ